MIVKSLCSGNRNKRRKLLIKQKKTFGKTNTYLKPTQIRNARKTKELKPFQKMFNYQNFKKLLHYNLKEIKGNNELIIE